MEPPTLCRDGIAAPRYFPPADAVVLRAWRRVEEDPRNLRSAASASIRLETVDIVARSAMDRES
jgi:hypothetical protein